MGRVYSMGGEKRIAKQGFGGKAWGKEISRRT
jgi:hypothetical protein